MEQEICLPLPEGRHQTYLIDLFDFIIFLDIGGFIGGNFYAVVSTFLSLMPGRQVQSCERGRAVWPRGGDGPRLSRGQVDRPGSIGSGQQALPNPKEIFSHDASYQVSGQATGVLPVNSQ
jgi:hypothetical protein